MRLAPRHRVFKLTRALHTRVIVFRLADRDCYPVNSDRSRPCSAACERERMRPARAPNVGQGLSPSASERKRLQSGVPRSKRCRYSCTSCSSRSMWPQPHRRNAIIRKGISEIYISRSQLPQVICKAGSSVTALYLSTALSSARHQRLHRRDHRCDAVGWAMRRWLGGRKGCLEFGLALRFLLSTADP